MEEEHAGGLGWHFLALVEREGRRSQHMARRPIAVAIITLYERFRLRFGLACADFHT